MVPDWEAYLKSLNGGAAGDELLPHLKQARFDIVIGPAGAATVSHLEFTTSNEQLTKRLSTVTGGLERMVKAFFQTWAQFLFTPILPEDGKSFTTEVLDGQYRFIQKTGQSEIITLVNRDLLVTEVRRIRPQTEVTVHPQFSGQPGSGPPDSGKARGYVLTGFGSGTTIASRAAEMKVSIDLQELDGFQLPKTVMIAAGISGVPLAFEGCQARKRN